jgi:uncharacterized protein
VPPPLSELDLDRLERYLTDPGRSDSTLPVDAVQGLFCAAVLGEGHEFATDDESDEIVDLLMRLYNETARQLNEGEGFDFILYGPEGAEDLATWAEGYLVGVDLAEPPWEDGADSEDLDDMLFPFLALTGRAREMALAEGTEWMGEEEEVDLLVQVREGLGNHLLDVRQFWFEKSIPPTVKRESPKVGRNDPCACGSGRKSKNCCGR